MSSSWRSSLETILVRQVPVHVVGIPPGVLQALPEEARLADAANLVAARDDTFFAILTHEFPQRVNDFRIYVFEPFVVRTEIDRRGVVEIALRRRVLAIWQIEDVFVAFSSAGILPAILLRACVVETRRQGCPSVVRVDRRYQAERHCGLVVPIGGGDFAGHARPVFSCGVRCHSASHPLQEPAFRTAWFSRHA